MPSVVQTVLTSGAFQASTWIVAAALMVWLVAHHADRISRSVERVCLALDRRAARKAALLAKTDAQRRHTLDVLERLMREPRAPT